MKGYIIAFHPAVPLFKLPTRSGPVGINCIGLKASLLYHLPLSELLPRGYEKRTTASCRSDCVIFQRSHPACTCDVTADDCKANIQHI